MPTLRTRTVKSSGGDYTSLAAWEIGEQADFVAADEIREADLYAMTDTTAVLIDGSTTDATRFMRIKVSERHAGAWDAAKYNLSVANSIALDIRDDYVRIEGLQVEVNAANAANQIPCNVQSQTVTNNEIRIDSCIFRTHTNVSFSTNTLGLNSVNTHSKIWNNVFQVRSAHASNRCVQIDGVTCYFYNNTVQGNGNGTGVRHFTSTTLMKNCTIVNHATCITVTSGTLTRTYSFSSDATMGAGTGNQNNVTEASMGFVDAANTDFHIGSSSLLKNAGTDLSADANLAFSTDIDGIARTGTWDIGADEFTGVEPPERRYPLSLVWP